jgi:hypothetical protein
MSARNSRITNNEVIYGFYLVFEEAGGVRLTRTEPHLDRAERAMFVQAKLPRTLWRTPSLRASIDIEIAGDALRSALGVDVDLKVIEP